MKLITILSKLAVNLSMIVALTLGVAKFTSHMKEGEIPARTTIAQHTSKHK